MSSAFAPGSKQHPIRFGVALPPAATSLDEQLLLAQAADAAGLDLIGVMDHPYHPRYLDTLSLIGMLLARTERVHIFPDVADLPLRPPQMLAKAAASLDLLSGGRFELGLGSGGYWDAIKTFGVRPLTRAQAVDALEEAIGIIRALWSGARGIASAASTTGLRRRPAGRRRRTKPGSGSARKALGCSRRPDASPTAGQHRSRRTCRTSGGARRRPGSTAPRVQLVAIPPQSAASRRLPAQ